MYLKFKVNWKIFQDLFILMRWHGIYVDEISSVERRTVSPPLSFLSGLSVTVRKNRQPFLWIPPHITTTTTAYCWCKALKAGIPTMLSLRGATNPPTVQPLAGSQTGQALSWRDYSRFPSCAMQAKEHQQTRELGELINEYKDGPL